MTNAGEFPDPRAHRPGRRQHLAALLRTQDALVTDAAGTREFAQQIRVTLFRTGRHFFAEQVLEQMLACVEIGQTRIKLCELLWDRVDVIEVLDGPLAELGARQLPSRPGATEDVAATMLGLAGRFEGGKKFGSAHHGLHHQTPSTLIRTLIGIHTRGQ